MELQQQDRWVCAVFYVMRWRLHMRYAYDARGYCCSFCSSSINHPSGVYNPTRQMVLLSHNFFVITLGKNQPLIYDKQKSKKIHTIMLHAMYIPTYTKSHGGPGRKPRNN